MSLPKNSPLHSSMHIIGLPQNSLILFNYFIHFRKKTTKCHFLKIISLNSAAHIMLHSQTFPILYIYLLFIEKARTLLSLTNCIPFFSTYNAASPNVSNIIYLLYSL